jgi:transcriptional regulator with XRE-family HTH domain
VIRLRELREAAFISQRDLAAKSGVGEATIVRIEKGYTIPHPATIRKLAEALGVAPGELVPDPSVLAEARREKHGEGNAAMGQGSGFSIASLE